MCVFPTLPSPQLLLLLEILSFVYRAVYTSQSCLSAINGVVVAFTSCDDHLSQWRSVWQELHFFLINVIPEDNVVGASLVMEQILPACGKEERRLRHSPSASLRRATTIHLHHPPPPFTLTGGWVDTRRWHNSTREACKAAVYHGSLCPFVWRTQ